ncbi:bifunctional acetaldehyde-CoA/alcohol dehydrogenase [Verrucomicrobiota bacterium]
MKKGDADKTAKPGKDSACREVIDALVDRALQAEAEFLALGQAQVDKVVHAMARAGEAERLSLARLAVEETGMGVFEDKVIKNQFATEYIYNGIKDVKTVGVIKRDAQRGLTEIAEPVGPIAAITPVTNPTSTVMFKTIIALKTRNPVIVAAHPKAIRCSTRTARTMYEAALAHGAPRNAIQWIEHPSVEGTNYLMSHPGVALVLATGGSGMVKAAYSSGTPAFGVGPGNTPVYIDRTARIDMAVTSIILSKTFDNGTICASEQSVVSHADIADEIEDAFERQGVYFCTPEETDRLASLAIDPERGMMSAAVVGQPAARIAERAGIEVPADTKILAVRLNGVGPEHPLSREKLSPILGFYRAPTLQDSLSRCREIISFGGLGHTAVIYAEDEEAIAAYQEALGAGRILVNCPAAHGAIGDLYNRLEPSLTLGCGTRGGNITTANISVMNLLNIKQVTERRMNMLWLQIPPEIYFNFGCLEYLRDVVADNVVIVTDPIMVKIGNVEKVSRLLQKVRHVRVFSDVEPDPSVETVMAGKAFLDLHKPEYVIALGGGSPMDAAKGMWLFYEHPDTRFDDLRLKFADIRKRTYRFPSLGAKCKLIAIPTTSGTGSEVTAFAVITDKEKGIKYPIADYAITPSVAIVDPEMAMTMPPSVTADTGLDVLTHAVEAYVSVCATDFTDPLAMQAIKLVFGYLARAYRDGDDREARERMHNASCIAGLAFTNAMLGINHSMAHILGSRFGIPHGRANAVLLPHVIEYNAARPTKFASFPNYEKHVADRKYAEIAAAVGVGGGTSEEGVRNLVDRIRALMTEVGLPLSLEELGVERDRFMLQVLDMAYIAFDDQCTGANPRYPLVREMEEIYRQAYGA